MASFLDQLRPQERRLLVLVGSVFFVVLNIWLVWPHFGDWQRTKAKQLQTERTLRQYQEEIAKIPRYQHKLRELQQAGSSVVANEQDLDLVRTIERLAMAHRVTIERGGAAPVSNTTKTNQFFEEQSRTIQVATGNDELIEFLVSLASTNSLIRVRDLNLWPSPSGTNLVGNITLVASYQKQRPTPAAARAPSNAPSAALASAAPTPASSNAPPLSPPSIPTAASPKASIPAPPAPATKAVSPATRTNAAAAQRTKPPPPLPPIPK